MICCCSTETESLLLAPPRRQQGPDCRGIETRRRKGKLRPKQQSLYTGEEEKRSTQTQHPRAVVVVTPGNNRWLLLLLFIKTLLPATRAAPEESTGTGEGGPSRPPPTQPAVNPGHRPIYPHTTKQNNAAGPAAAHLSPIQGTPPTQQTRVGEKAKGKRGTRDTPRRGKSALPPHANRPPHPPPHPPTTPHSPQKKSPACLPGAAGGFRRRRCLPRCVSRFIPCWRAWSCAW